MDVPSFSYLSRVGGYWSGAAVMRMIGMRMPKKYGLEGKDLRQELAGLVNEFVDAGARSLPACLHTHATSSTEARTVPMAHTSTLPSPRCQAASRLPRWHGAHSPCTLPHMQAVTSAPTSNNKSVPCALLCSCHEACMMMCSWQPRFPWWSSAQSRRPGSVRHASCSAQH